MPLDNTNPIKVIAGDLIYGVAAARTAYLQKKPFLGSGAFLIDDLAVMPGELPTEPSYLSWFANKVYMKPRLKSFEKSLSAHNIYKSAIEGLSSGNENTRRKCKGGLDWAVNGNRTVHFLLDELDITAVVKKNNIRVGRSIYSAEKERSITGAELRWIYRNRNNPLVQNRVQFWLAFAPCLPPWEQDIPIKQTGLLYSKTLWLGYKPTKEWTE
ncbi:hypothetical protein SAMN05192549_10544 [Duganella sacchari]|uniref:Uncharacterized protein n=1 Tax=Duganella sacchari TaxID=551987 RepID=A0A1M7PH40_9BURK|nr:hypothetical protein [Duganella sacchari]SHN16082.1 hypothetical protein SAMN05192549_10544 [Duganella sacchari]